MNATGISGSALARGRGAPGSRLLITGGTGFLGSHVAARLLRDGFAVTLLARPSPGATADERVRRVLAWHGISEELRRRVRVVSADLRDPALGLEASERSGLLAETDEVIHCASETSFAERRRKQLEDVNVVGLERLLDLAASGRCARFHLLSTAFVAGRREGVCSEGLSSAREFHNAYEETKCRAEAIVWERCTAARICPMIYRPSIVYGHSVTGRSLLFKALYHPVRAFVFLRDVYLKDIRERGGARARAAGAHLEPDGRTLRLPLRMRAEGPGIDLIPVDFFADAFAAIFASARGEGIFHLVNGRQTPAATIVSYICRMFGLSGVEVASDADLAGSPRNAIEAAYDEMVDAYRPYMSERRIFAATNAGSILNRQGLVCPDFTYEIFECCMRYAVDADWGRRHPVELAGS